MNGSDDSTKNESARNQVRMMITFVRSALGLATFGYTCHRSRL